MDDATVEPTRQNVTRTERVIAEMLLEDTGAHMLDSGIYGRGWQVTRAKYGLDGGLPNSSWDGSPRSHEDPEEDDITRVARQMRDEPEGSIDDYGTVYVSTFHWLTSRLEYDPDLDRRWLMYDRVINIGRDRYDKTSWMESAERFLKALVDHGDVSGGIYNHESELDEVLQFARSTPTPCRSGRFGATTKSPMRPRITGRRSTHAAASSATTSTCARKLRRRCVTPSRQAKG